MKIKNIQEVSNLSEETTKVVNNDTLSKSAKMKQLFAYGLDIKEIASLLNVRYNFVYNVISNETIVNGLEVETTKVSSKKELVRELFNQGNTLKEIAIELKTNYNYIYKLVREIKAETEKQVNDSSEKQVNE